MKKALLKVLGLALIVTVGFTSCDEGTVNLDDVIENLKNGIMDGTLEEDYTLDASKSYALDGSFIVKNGVTLTIPAGTQIVADAGGTDVFIAVMMGGKINIEGTEAKPVLMSSVDAKPGDWGGLTICGKGVTTEGENATAEVGGFVYGGTNNADNSGSIEYLIIKGTGAQINTESQYNGVSFYAVGSGTTVNNVAVINGSDDGVEFFGGAVEATNLFLQNNEDDAIDWTEGWSGSVTNAYVEHTSDFSTVVEADGDNENPMIENLTAVSTVGGTALQFKKESGATITGLSLTGYETIIDMKDEGALSNVSIEGEVADSMKSYAAEATVDVNDFVWVNATVTEGATTLLEQGIMNGVLTSDYTLSASSYSLTGSFIISDGASLTIPAGTQINALAGGTEVYIAVMMGGKIFIEGTAEDPVLITSDDAMPGEWGGLTLCGKGITTEGENAVAEVGGFVYGGTKNDDNSGKIEYLVIKGTGAQINSESQYNGVSFYAVGSATTLNNIAVINGADDGVEFFGGAAEVTNLFLKNNEDDAIDWTEGWSGSVTNSYVEHTSAFSTVLEADGINENPTITNLTAVSTVGGTALQFKKESGATIIGISLSGYSTILDMKDEGALSNVTIDGDSASYEMSYAGEANVDFESWTWVDVEPVDVVAQGQLSGYISGDVTLNASTAYTLTGSCIVPEGASLTIPAGTKITANAGGTEVYIAVLMGGTINIDGTASNPVVISSVDANPGDWGGLTICGKAITTEGENAIAEVGGFIYGGTNAADNSGSVTFLVIKGTGAQINSESQYNGVSLYAVGSGTTIENIAVINGADDGVEFFGGSAKVTNIYLENNEDDAVDWTEGWDGKVVNTYISHTIEGFSTAFEGDKVNGSPVFENVTAISTQGGTGLQFKKESGAVITGLYLDGYDFELDMKDEGALSNVQIEGADADATLVDGQTHKYLLNSGKQAAATVDVSAWTWKEATL